MQPRSNKRGIVGLLCCVVVSAATGCELDTAGTPQVIAGPLVPSPVALHAPYVWDTRDELMVWTENTVSRGSFSIDTDDSNGAIAARWTLPTIDFARARHRPAGPVNPGGAGAVSVVSRRRVESRALVVRLVRSHQRSNTRRSTDNSSRPQNRPGVEGSGVHALEPARTATARCPVSVIPRHSEPGPAEDRHHCARQLRAGVASGVDDGRLSQRLAGFSRRPEGTLSGAG